MANENDWYYNSYLGEITEMIGPWAALTVHSGIGWHGPFMNKSDAVAFYNAGKAANPGWKPPTSDLNIIGQAGNAISSVPGVASNVAGAVGSAASDIVNAPGKAYTNAVDAVLGPLQHDVRIWAVRVSEFILGVALIIVGLAHITGADTHIGRLARQGAKQIPIIGKAVK